MKLTLTTLTIVFLVLSAHSQQIGITKQKKQSLSKYSVQLNPTTKERVTPDQELIEKSKQSSFNFHYSAYLKSDAANKNYSALLLAYGIDSTNSELYYELAKYHEVNQNEKEKNRFCVKLKSANLTAALREYAYNTLVSVEKNGVLITYGERDTYPIWVLQTTENFRTDVQVLNYDLLLNEGYRNRKSKELGIRFSRKYSEPIDLLKEIGPRNENKSIYYSLTVSHLVLKELKSDLYTTGLALKFSKKEFDNLTLLRTNWENNFLKQELSKFKIVEIDNQLHLNYILPLIQLVSLYEKELETAEAEETKKLIHQLASMAGKEKAVKQILSK